MKKLAYGKALLLIIGILVLPSLARAEGMLKTKDRQFKLLITDYELPITKR